jgi:S-DNA-T family DNA segregation ATPase FtsK/SpoIIIE
VATQRSKPASKAKKKAPPARARRSAPKGGGGFQLPRLEQRHYDLIGLGLVAFAVFLSFVVYLKWDGGRAGEAVVDGLRWLIGSVHYVAPAAAMAIGVILVMKPVLPAIRPFRAGGICLFFALTLMLEAGTLGFGPGGDDIRQKGGKVGALLHDGLATALGSVGAHIVGLFLFLAAILLLTGASVASVIRATTDSVSTRTRALRERRSATEELAAIESGATEPRISKADFWADEDPALDPPPAEPVFEEIPPEPDPEPIAEEPETEPDLHASDDEPEPTAVQPVDPEHLTPAGRYRSDVTDSPDFVWRLPDPRRLKRATGDASKPDTSNQEKVAAQLVEALGHFGVEAKIIGTIAGPHITRYELRLAPGTKVGKVAQLKDDLAYALAASDVRILAPIPGKQAVGVEVPNARRRIVHLGDVFQEPPADWSPLTVWLGKDVAGRAIAADLAKMPHLLVAGTTGAGKSGCINAMLCSLLLRADPHQMRMVLVDPKQVELNHYESIPHLLTPVITSPRKAATALQNLVREMEQRYSYMALARTRSLNEMNKVRESRGEAPLPYILCVIDELADLMMVAPADVEDSIIRIAQKARAVGIHLVLATQSPRVDVITGMIKANVPSRIAFAVSSQTDSRVILDQNGAEALLGQGDMLFSPVGSSRLQRIQGAYADEAEIALITEMWRRQGEPEFQEELLEEVESEDAGSDAGEAEFSPDEDPLLEEAIRLVAEMQTASTSMLQRRLRLGYTRAGRLIDMLERRGVISGYEGSKPRQVLITEGDVPRVLANLAEAGRLSADE